MEAQLKVGDIVHIFDYCGRSQYVVEFFNSVDYSLEVRDWLTLSLSEASDLNMREVVKNNL